MEKKQTDKKTLESICKRAHYLANQMIYMANHRDDKMKGDPKVGGHSSASSSALHILGALHLVVKSGFDFIANKPHASPTDHSYNYLLDLFFHTDGKKFSLEEKNIAMTGLRAYQSEQHPFVFQSYHSAYDPDHHNFFPSGTVGIPPVNAGYLALAYRMAKEQGFEVPDAHFWSLIGDSEFREGSLFEATPDFAERELGNLTWIVDYNRQSLDGHRISNKKIMGGTDDKRIENTMLANGWDVIQLRHGKKREELFKKTNGIDFKNLLEQELEDYELQSLLLIKNPDELKSHMDEKHPHLKKFLSGIKPQELFEGLRDFGGHDIESVINALVESKKNPRKPCLIVIHTLKGWGLEMAAQQGNHSALPDEDEMLALRKAQGLNETTLFAPFEKSSSEGKYLLIRGQELANEINEQNEIKNRNWTNFQSRLKSEIPNTLDINFKMANHPHTQWMLGQCTAKLTRLANTTEGGSDKNQKALTDFEKSWKPASEMLITMAPDVGTSTNLNPAMDGKIFGSPVVEDFETEFDVKDTKLPDLVPGENTSDRFIRFEIVESNTMSCMGSFGRLRDVLGAPLLPLMTVYDFFVKRALDQFFYNLYWKSSFILVGTPSGVTLSPEGAQHGWKSDFQIPNQITWEPAFCHELDWILSDAIKRHALNDNTGRTGVYIRGVTRGLDQSLFLKNLKKQMRFKTSQNQPLHPDEFTIEGAVQESSVESMSEAEILNVVRDEVLKGGYYLIDYRGYAGYDPGDNVVNIFAMGSLVFEAIKSSQQLLAKGIYANVIVVSSTDLLVGNLAHENNYSYLKNELGISGNLFLQPLPNGNAQAAELVTLSGRRVPVVSVHDGEPGLLDNIGSIVGVKQTALAVRKHSKCGRPVDIYSYHHIDESAICEACETVLNETAMESVHISQKLVQTVATMSQYETAPEAWKV